jgi:hypothetical protein
MDGILTPGIASIIVFNVWWYIHKNTLNYERCPNCHSFRKADAAGSSKNGKLREATHSTYDVYRGTTQSGNVITKHYDVHTKKNVKVYQKYLDHQECRVCGHLWDVDRKELIDEYNQYD